MNNQRLIWAGIVLGIAVMTTGCGGGGGSDGGSGSSSGSSSSSSSSSSSGSSSSSSSGSSSSSSSSSSSGGSSSSSSSSSSSGGSVQILQMAQYQATSTGNTGGDTSGNWNVTLSNVQAGSTLYVVGIWPNYADLYANMTVTDGTHTYTELGRYDDQTLFADGIQGTQSIAHWYTANVAAGSYTINMNPNDSSLPTGTFEDYAGLVVFEIAGASSSPLDGSAENFQANVAPATDAVNVSVTNTGSSGLLVAVSTNTVDATAPTTLLPGTGMTNEGTLWNFFGDSRYAGSAVSAVISSAGTHSALFTPQETTSPSPNYLTVGAIFR